MNVNDLFLVISANATATPEDLAVHLETLAQKIREDSDYFINTANIKGHSLGTGVVQSTTYTDHRNHSYTNQLAMIERFQERSS